MCRARLYGVARSFSDEFVIVSPGDDAVKEGVKHRAWVRTSRDTFYFKMVDNWERLAAGACLPVETPAEEISNLRGTSDDTTTWDVARCQSSLPASSPPRGTAPARLDENTQLVESHRVNHHAVYSGKMRFVAPRRCSLNTRDAPTYYPWLVILSQRPGPGTSE